MKVPKLITRSTSTQGRHTASPLSPRRLLSYPLLGAAIIVSGLLVSFLIVELSVVERGTEAARRAAINEDLNGFRAYLDSRLLELRVALGQIVTAPALQTALTTAVATGDRAELARLAPILSAAIPYARRVAIFPRGQAEADPTAAVPINFAAKDMLRRAESVSWVEPEAYSVRGQTLIYAVMRVTGARQTGPTAEPDILGTVLVALDAGYFSEPLQAFEPPDGLLTANQRFAGGKPLTFVRHGRDHALPGESIDARLAAEHWYVEYAPGADVMPATAGDSVLAAMLIAIVAAVAGTFVAYFRLFRTLRSDLGSLGEFLTRGARDGRSPLTGSFTLELMQRFAEAHAARLQPAGEPSPAPAPAAPTAEKAEPSGARVPVSEVAAGVANADRNPFGSGEFDIEVIEEDNADLDALADALDEETGSGETAADDDGLATRVDAEIFRSYDVRGIVGKNLSEDTALLLGRAIGAEAVARGVDTLVVGGDARASTPLLKAELIEGLTTSGVKVIDIGEVPTPVLYYAAYAYDTRSGVMVTGSHNPPEYNGFKIMLAGETLAEGAIDALRSRIETLDFVSGKGSVESAEVVPSYIERIVSDIALAQTLKVVVDCGNGIAGAVAPQLLEELGCDVIPLYCDVDSSFPNHHPDPAEPANLTDLIARVKAEGADLGIAFDGDGDRIGVVTDTGEIVYPDRLLMLFARDVVGRNPGADVVYDVKCSRHLNSIIAEYGGRPIMWKTGHSHIKAKIYETGALLGGEFSGHICFLERWYGFDDALYSAARLLEILAAETVSVSEVFEEFPLTFSTPEIKIPTTDAGKFELLARIAEQADFEDGSISTIDGLRVDFADGWGLVRASNTSPVLSLRFEGDTPDALERIIALFQRELTRIDPALGFEAP